jgi:hypothetical protein
MVKRALLPRWLSPLRPPCLRPRRRSGPRRSAAPSCSWPGRVRTAGRSSAAWCALGVFRGVGRLVELVPPILLVSAGTIWSSAAAPCTRDRHSAWARRTLPPNWTRLCLPRRSSAWRRKWSFWSVSAGRRVFRVEGRGSTRLSELVRNLSPAANEREQGRPGRQVADSAVAWPGARGPASARGR